MRSSWLAVVVAAVVLVGCHPRISISRDDLADTGSGGSGGLSSVRVKVFAAIAARDYEHARELVRLAADLGDVERARLEQAISAAERGLIPFLEDKIPHIFRAAEGHFGQDTAEARELIQATAAEANFVGLSKHGNQVYQRILDTGMQVWVWVRDGTIREAGHNDVPLSIEELLK